MNLLPCIPALLFLLIFACKKPPEEPQPDKLVGDKAILVGIWDWTHTHHRFNWCDGPELNETIEPEEETYSLHLKEDGYVDFYKNESILKSHYVKVSLYYEVEDDGFVFTLNLDGLESQKLSGRVFPDSMRTWDFPYVHEIEGCEDYSNYFVKE